MIKDRIGQGVLSMAHRGDRSLAPENTLAAFSLALDEGVDAIEMDIRLSKDGRIIVIHDERVDRTTDGTGLVEEMTLEEIKGLDAGSWFDPRFAGERIPTLEEALSLIRGRAGIQLEIKGSAPGLAEGALEMLQAMQMTDDVIIISFAEENLQRVKEIAPQQYLLLLSSKPDAIDRCLALGCEGISITLAMADEGFIAAAHAAGLTVTVWNANEEADVKRMLDLGADFIASDYPSLLVETIRQNA